MTRVNLLDDAAMVVDEDEPDGYRAPYRPLREPLGGALMGGTLVLLAPGQAVCPYHYEAGEEEWLVVLSGTPTVRTPAGDERLEPGDVVCFPRGPEGAHQIGNAADAAEPSRVLILSERAEVAVAVYPDSDKVGVHAPGHSHRFRRTDERDYWDGEPPRPGAA